MVMKDIPPAPHPAAAPEACGCACHALCPGLSLSLHQFAESLGNAVDAKDHCTRSHSEEVAAVGRLIALGLGLDPAQADMIHIAGHLHDIGKIGLPDAILGKTGPLTPAEWAMVRLHPVIGADIVRPVAALTGPGGIADMILHHHERFDGGGYPHGLRRSPRHRPAQGAAQEADPTCALSARMEGPGLTALASGASCRSFVGGRTSPSRRGSGSVAPTEAALT